MNIADRILCLRKKKGVSQEELAYSLGVSRQAVSKWESDQSVPELDKIILMSDYFEVTTDYLLTGKEEVKKGSSDNSLLSKILYLSSAALIGIGLLAAFASWNIEESSDVIWGSLIIQVVGVVGYFMGKLVSKEKSSFMIDFLNIAMLLFIPVSLIVTVIFNSVISPYPIGLNSILAFIIGYIVLLLTSFLLIKKYKR